MLGGLFGGQVCAFTAVLLLAAFVPWSPSRAGLPPYRPLEMLFFWAAFALMLGGTCAVRRNRSAFELPPHPVRREAILASAGLLVANLVATLTLVNYLYTGVWGSRILALSRMELFDPRRMGWFTVPLLMLAVGSQIPFLIKAARQNVAAPARACADPPSSSALTVLMTVLLVALLLVFLLFSAASAVTRAFSLGAMTVTFLLSLVMLAATVYHMASLQHLLAEKPSTPSGPR